MIPGEQLFAILSLDWHEQVWQPFDQAALDFLLQGASGSS